VTEEVLCVSKIIIDIHRNGEDWKAPAHHFRSSSDQFKEVP
jgi:hypothetical protein